MKLSEWFRKSQFPLMLALGTYGAMTCVAGYLYPRLLGYAWVLPGVYMLLSWLGLILPGKGRVLLGIVGVPVLFLPVVFLRGEILLPSLIVGILYGVLLIYSLTFGSWDQNRELPGGLLGFCFTLLLIGCLLTGLDSRLSAVRLPVRGALYGFVLLAMLSMNRSSRNLAAFGKRGVSAAMRRKNLMLTLGMFAIAMTLALIPSLAELLRWAWEALLELLERLKELFPEETEPLETTMATEMATGHGGGMPEAPPAKKTPAYVYTVMWVIALGVAIPGVIVVAKKFWKRIKEALGRLYNNLWEDLFAQQEDFEDEITDIRKENQQEKLDQKRGRNGRTGSPFARLTPAQKIRHRYRRLYQKHPEWRDHNTARENLPSEAARLYEKARYSQHPVNEQDAATFKSQTQ